MSYLKKYLAGREGVGEWEEGRQKANRVHIKLQSELEKGAHPSS